MMKRAMITGAAAGIGLSAAELFAEKGWKVLGVDIEPMPEHHENIQSRICDLSDPAQVDQLFQDVGNDWDGLDALVNNAAIQICKPLLETTLEEWDRAQATNLRSAFLTSNAAYALLAEAGGAIVNVASVHAFATSKGIANYAASKGGLLAMTRAQALEFAPDNIRVNAVLPGAVDTAMLRQGFERSGASADDIEPKLAEVAAKTPLGRVGRPREIAMAILFLADNERSSFVTGQSLVVDGGALAHLSTE